jgi:membrane-bound inhibitor of C-type lysozyme
MKIQYDKVTWYSKILALLVYIATLFIGFFLGMRYESLKTIVSDYEKQSETIKAVFACPQNKAIYAEFDNKENKVNLILSDGRSLTLSRTISGSGARYANSDESFIFWNKGNGAFIEEKEFTTYEDCITAE